MKVAIVVNNTRTSSELINHEILAELAAQHNLSYELFTTQPEDIQRVVKELLQKSFNCILVAGGDGTVRCVAEVLIKTDIPLMIFPTGTFNLFAGELEHPKDVSECFRIIKNSKVKKVDLGSVNGKLFINHTIIGFYSHVLKIRKKYKRILRNYKILKIIFNAFNFLKVIPIYTLTIKSDSGIQTYKTSMVFVGNNYHLTNLLDFGSRETLSSGLLAIYILNCQTRWELIKGLFSILFNTKNKKFYLNDFTADEFTIFSESKSINIDIDGELHKLESPLNYSIHHKKLSVLVP